MFNKFNTQWTLKSIASVLMFSFFILTSCSDDKNEQNQPKMFFDLKGFVEGQITMLNQSKPLVAKTMTMQNDSNQISSKEVNWKKELELFIQADINKPAYRLSYNANKPDSLTFNYVLKPGQDLPVRYLKIRMNRVNGTPIQIEARLESKNKLYTSEKNIEMILSESGNVSKITSYKIDGFQQLILTEKKPFDIKGILSY